ncbi:uncharacterized protein BO96DRAFT_346762, partial [Aspergillus niger CBS 101883]|uniref:uncharacterized protein n=1 Tax=Aspergillus lacticoffeatus (strain CBS 101883) TaxID=1450533 RepID=UPI000D7FC8F8
HSQLLLSVFCSFIFGMYLTRLSQILFLHRVIIITDTQWLRTVLVVIIVFISLGSCTLVACFIFACQPISKSWNIALPGKCINKAAIFVSVAVFNIISDFCLIALLVLLIWHIQLSNSHKKKFFILSTKKNRTFIASAVRLRFTIPLLKSDDLTYKMAPVALLVGIEANVTIITVCFPAVRQSIRRTALRTSTQF